MPTLQALLLGTVLSVSAAAQIGAIQRSTLPPVPPVVGPGAVDCSVGDQATHEACIKAMTASYTYLYESHLYDIESLHHRAESIRWSLLASQIMFVVVLILVLSGLLFAAIQFRLAMRAVVVAPEKNPKPSVPADPSAPNLETNIELSSGGIKMQSSVLGVIILALSMAFFYLYAEFVYPIHELRREVNDVAQGPGK